MKLRAVWCFVPGMKPDFWEGHLAIQNNLKANFFGCYIFTMSFRQSFWLKMEDWGGCVWAAYLMPRLIKLSDSEAPAFSYSQCCWGSVSVQFPSFLNMTQKQREETCDVRNVALVWVGAALISAVQKYFCQHYVFLCWAIWFCFYAHGCMPSCKACLPEEVFSLVMLTGSILRYLRDTLGF